jgi:hypothetical protein
MRPRALSLLAAACLLLTGITLSGCDPEEQDRVLSFEKGIYHGTPDTPLTQQTAEDLRFRAKKLGGL